MPAINDPIFGPHAAALGLWRQRNEVLAANIANADTPGFKARDVDFEAVLQGQADTVLAMRRTSRRHLDVTGGLDATLKYRVPLQPSLDGNTVEADVEQAEFASNALRYQASLRFINGRIGSLRAAIMGSHSA